MSRSVVDGHSEREAVELANQEIMSVYRSRNEDPEVMADPLGAVYFELIENGAESVVTEPGRPVR